MKSRYIKYALLKKRKSKYGRIIVLTGARQTGKTTLSKLCYPGYTYLSIEDPVLRSEYKALTASQWKEYYPQAILDEIQKEPQLIESIKSVYDQYETSRYLLLGSSQLLLLEKVKESLAGRCSIKEVYPLTLPEMLSTSWETEVKDSVFQYFIKHQIIPALIPSVKLHQSYPEIERWFRHYLQFGGYPALVDEKMTTHERNEWLHNYIRTYLEHDIRDLASFRNLEPFVITQKISATLTGQVVNYTALAREAGITNKTAQRFLQYLQLSYQTIELKPWHKNKMKRLTKSSKLHYLDPGIQQAILNKQGNLNGHEFESAIIAEVYKQLKNIEFNGDIYHLRTSDGREIDLLIELQSGYITIEVKQSTRVDRTDVRHLYNIEEILDKPVIKGFIISRDPSVKNFGDNIMAIPASLFLS